MDDRQVHPAHPLWDLIAPLRPGNMFLKGWALAETKASETLISLNFSHKEQGSVTLLLAPPDSDAPCWQATQQVRISVAGRDLSGPALTLAKAVTALVRRNETAGAVLHWRHHLPTDDPDSRCKRTDLLISTACGNHCVFCTDRPIFLKRLDTPEVEAQIDALAAQGFAGLEFTSMEPTLRPDLPRLVAHAKAAGISEVSVVTSGVRTADPSYCRDLLAAGLSKVTLSVHSPTPELETTITGNPESFDQKLRSLRNLSALKEEGACSFRFYVNTVMHTHNLPVLADLVRFVAAFAVEELDLYFVYPHGLAKEHFDAVVPWLDDLRPALEAALEAAQRVRPRVVALDVPLCVLPPSFIGSFRQDQVSHWASSLGQAPVEPAENPWGRRRIFPGPCDNCRLKDRCGGLWWYYVHRRGHGELRPLKLDR